MLTALKNVKHLDKRFISYATGASCLCKVARMEKDVKEG